MHDAGRESRYSYREQHEIGRSLSEINLLFRGDQCEPTEDSADLQDNSSRQIRV